MCVLLQLGCFLDAARFRRIGPSLLLHRYFPMYPRTQKPNPGEFWIGSAVRSFSVKSSAMHGRDRILEEVDSILTCSETFSTSGSRRPNEDRKSSIVSGLLQLCSVAEFLCLNFEIADVVNLRFNSHGAWPVPETTHRGCNCLAAC